MSLAGPVEPGDPRRPPRPSAPPGGVALVDRSSGEPRIVRVLTLKGSPYGMVLTHDERTLIVASDDLLAFVDVGKLVSGSANPVLGYLTDAPLAGRFYVNVTKDDRWAFVSDESERSISVIDLRLHARQILRLVPSFAVLKRAVRQSPSRFHATTSSFTRRVRKRPHRSTGLPYVALRDLTLPDFRPNIRKVSLQYST